MIRTLLKFLANRNSEEIVHKLSDSYLMRRAAQTVASLFIRSKHIIDEAKEERLKDINPQKLRSLLDQFQNNVKEEMEKVKKELEEKSKKP